MQERLKDIVWLFLLSFFSIACQSGRHVDKEINMQEIPVELKGPDREAGISLYDIVDPPRVFYVDPGFPISYVYSIKYVCGRYYLTDFRRQSILVFDDAGQVLLNLSRKGRAENEWVKMECFDVNPSNGQISVYDIATRRIVVYSESGEYLRQIVLEDGVGIFNDFAVKEDGSYLVYISFGNPAVPTNPTGLIDVDRDGTIARVLAPLDDDFRHVKSYIPYTNFHRLSDGTLTLRGEQDKNEIYHYSSEGVLTVPYQFKYDVEWPASVRAMEKPFEESVYYSVSQYFETDHWLGALIYFRKDERILLFYNKETGEAFSGKASGDRRLADVFKVGEKDIIYYSFSAGDRIMQAFSPEDSDDNRIRVIVYPEK
ncbi:MAG: 6-bladed beta-propeller [Bacteroidales bacterium]|nr:6-bladed beta-propeller [Bacteroidales bacterium]